MLMLIHKTIYNKETEYKHNMLQIVVFSQSGVEHFLRGQGQLRFIGSAIRFQEVLQEQKPNFLQQFILF